MHFNNLRCRRTQRIFKTFNRFIYSFYFQIIIPPVVSAQTCIIE